MKQGAVSQSADEREERLWQVSQRYMLGEIDITELAEEEKPQALSLRKAVVALARIEPELTPQSADEQEEQLWRASQRYMRGKLSIAELEDFERSHASNLKRAIIALAKSKVKRYFRF